MLIRHLTRATCVISTASELLLFQDYSHFSFGSKRRNRADWLLEFANCLRHRAVMKPSKLKEFLQRWAISVVAVLVATYLVKGGIHYEAPLDLLVASLVLGMLNMVVRPLLLLLSLPLLIVTLGLFTLIINAALLYFVGWLLKPSFRVDNFSDAFWGALVITLVSLVLNSLTGTGQARITMQLGKPRPPADKSGGGGPVIDV